MYNNNASCSDGRLMIQMSSDDSGDDDDDGRVGG
jgi:hypothetical protein